MSDLDLVKLREDADTAYRRPCKHRAGQSCWDCYVNRICDYDEHVVTLIDRITALTEELRLARGAIAAQDEREQKAGILCGIPREKYGCDWPDAVAEELNHQRSEAERLRCKLSTWNRDYSQMKMIECENCKGCGRVGSGPIPGRAQGYLESQCYVCNGRGTVEEGYELTQALRPIYQRAIVAAGTAERREALASELELMADLASSGFMMSAPQEQSLRAAAAELRKNE